VTDSKKKGDFDQWQRKDTGGNKKAHGTRIMAAPATSRARGTAGAVSDVKRAFRAPADGFPTPADWR
jgi:hypothetical protein